MTAFETQLSVDPRGVARLIIDRPAKRNALSSTLMHALIDAFAAISRRDDVRAVVLSGAGDAAFCGGADLKELAALDATTARTFITLVHRTCRACIECPVPVIARLHGAVLGAGLELAAACDLRIASNDARFAMPEVRLGIPSVVEAALLPRLIGSGRARWLVLTGEAVDANRALEWGLVNDTVPPAHLDAAVDRTVTTLLRNSDIALRLQKRLCTDWDERTMAEAIDRSVDAFAVANERSGSKA